MEENKRYCVIMAGGIGSRFWPLSRQSKPKQFLDILGTGRTFIRQTYERFAKTIPASNFLVVTSVEYKEQVLHELPELSPSQVLCEPLRRNTAPCIAYAAFRIFNECHDASMVVTPSDHFILDEEMFREVMNEGFHFAEQGDSIVTIGLKPTRPETGYGYIQVDNQAPSWRGVQKVKIFTEKPNLEMAKVFVDSGEFFWNSGIFIWKAETILRSLHRHLPEIYELFASIAEEYGTSKEAEGIDTVYSQCQSISIDYGVMERADNVYVRCGDFGWSDIGTWGSLYQQLPKDKHYNASNGDNVFFYDSSDNLVSLPQGRIAVIEGLKDYIVVSSDEALLICRKENEQEIRTFVEDVKYKKGKEYI